MAKFIYTFEKSMAKFIYTFEKSMAKYNKKVWQNIIKKVFIIEMSFVYLLVSTNGNTYVGATVDLNRRLRQHNKEIKGGARATGIKVVQGEIWTRAAHVSGFPDWKSTLQFEWRWKQISRKYPAKMNPLERRMAALKELLALEQSTSKAIPFVEWPLPPEVHCEMEEAERLFV
jgi:structure-specific endonuclease subunit SLX1